LRALLLLAVVLVCACAWGIAPVRHDGSAAPPPTWRYAGQHGRPLAYGGNVCAVASTHVHDYPPSPREAFITTAAGLVDTRKTWPFYGNHRHAGRTCFHEAWHLHLEPPDQALVWDDKRGGFRAP
jgi:hypothetical protein